MDFDTFKRAVDSVIDHVGTIGIMGGEPTLHPEYERFVSYLDNALQKERRLQCNPFIYPQRNFSRAVRNSIMENSKDHHYTTGRRRIVDGAGLWSSMNASFKKNYEISCDVFKQLELNDHGNIAYHQPILISRKELGISDNEFHELRDKCWINQLWSASITPKGAFFCEIAAALDILFEGPGGWPIEPGWWMREEKDFGEQLQWCDLCGVALHTFTRDAREGIDDISPVLYEKLKMIGSQKLEKGKVNLLEITDGVISENSMSATKNYKGGNNYVDGNATKFAAEKSILFPSGFESVILGFTGNNAIHLVNAVKNNFVQLDSQKILCFDLSLYQETVSLLGSNPSYSVIDSSAISFGQAFYNVLVESNPDKYLIVTSFGVQLSNTFRQKLMECIINPGTLHYIQFTQVNNNDNEYIAYATPQMNGFAALLNKRALSLRKMGTDTIVNAMSFQEIADKWIPEKIVEFSNSMNYECPVDYFEAGKRYAIYGAGQICRQACRRMNECDAKLACIVDSNQLLWQTEFEGQIVHEPKYIHSHKNEIDYVVIGSNYHYKEIKNAIRDLGFTDGQMVMLV